MKLSILKEINSNEVIRVALVPVKHKPNILVVTSDAEFIHPLTTGFEIFCCNEFLKQLNVCHDDNLVFDNYVQYSHTIDFCNRLLEYKRIMEKLTQKTYKEIGVSAYQIYNVILNRLLEKHNMKKSEYFTAVVKIPLENWIAEALPYFK